MKVIFDKRKGEDSIALWMVVDAEYDMSYINNCSLLIYDEKLEEWTDREIEGMTLELFLKDIKNNSFIAKYLGDVANYLIANIDMSKIHLINIEEIWKQ